MSADEVAKELRAKLKSISEDRDFILGVMSNAPHIDDRKTIVDCIEKGGEEATEEAIILLSVYLGQKRESKNG